MASVQHSLGDVVTLASGGPDMTVTKILAFVPATPGAPVPVEAGIVCSWMDKDAVSGMSNVHSVLLPHEAALAKKAAGPAGTVVNHPSGPSHEVGETKAVSVSGSILTLSRNGGPTYTIVIPPNAAISVNGIGAPLGDIHPGDTVVVSGTPPDTVKATR